MFVGTKALPCEVCQLLSRIKRLGCEPEVEALGESAMVDRRIHWFAGLGSREYARETMETMFGVMGFRKHRVAETQWQRSVYGEPDDRRMAGVSALLGNIPTEPDSRVGLDVLAVKAPRLSV